MRSYTFDVLWLETADGIYDRITEGEHWYTLARDLVRQGRATLVENSRTFAGYGDSYDEGYNRYNYTVTEVLG